ncbi:hypothetical protein JXC34_06155 [Candidatus Woesearchaeota archaeon]|nr:hypothetical protein [Candidatus Woesearchaeota archaeon]
MISDLEKYAEGFDAEIKANIAEYYDIGRHISCFGKDVQALYMKTLNFIVEEMIQGEIFGRKVLIRWGPIREPSQDLVAELGSTQLYQIYSCYPIFSLGPEGEGVSKINNSLGFCHVDEFIPKDYGAFIKHVESATQGIIEIQKNPIFPGEVYSIIMTGAIDLGLGEDVDRVMMYRIYANQHFLLSRQ